MTDDCNWAANTIRAFKQNLDFLCLMCTQYFYSSSSIWGKVTVRHLGLVMQLG